MCRVIHWIFVHMFSLLKASKKWEETKEREWLESRVLESVKTPSKSHESRKRRTLTNMLLLAARPVRDWASWRESRVAAQYATAQVTRARHRIAGSHYGGASHGGENTRARCYHRRRRRSVPPRLYLLASATATDLATRG